MKQHLIGAVLTLAVLFGGYEAYQARQWKKIADKRGYYAEQTGAYLFGPSGVVTPQGEDINRAQLADIILHEKVDQLEKLGLLKDKK